MSDADECHLILPSYSYLSSNPLVIIEYREKMHNTPVYYIRPDQSEQDSDDTT